ncbi:M23 family metallopeptidase [Pseudoduganella violaceinigra]|uniref:M23 family metallopeptidase n=1 Tax=Pseudoduganella violaceinigra TaxID=246602 RepID=UPI0004174F80|nr:M23 family metallopeptidase [Pseudoduganella violaceinigra]
MSKITNILLLAVLAAAHIVQPAAAMPEPLDIPPPQEVKEPLALDVKEPVKEAPSAQWRLPLEGGRVSSFFGASRGRRAHGGIDFSVPRNTPVMATNDGTVVASGMGYLGDRKYGNVVVIEHEGGLRSLYAHLNKRNVNIGDTVAAGELIGLSGATGHATGPHLHLEAYQDGTRIDPNRFMLANLEDTALASAMHAKRTGVEEVPPAPHSKDKSGGKSSKKKTQVAQKSSKSHKRA